MTGRQNWFPTRLKTPLELGIFCDRSRTREVNCRTWLLVLSKKISLRLFEVLMHTELLGKTLLNGIFKRRDVLSIVLNCVPKASKFGNF